MSLSQESEGEAAACGGRNDGEGKCQISAWMSMLCVAGAGGGHPPKRAEPCPQVPPLCAGVGEQGPAPRAPGLRQEAEG